MPAQHAELVEFVQQLIDNLLSDIEILDLLAMQLPLSWPDWQAHVDGEQDLLRLIQQLRAGTI